MPTFSEASEPYDIIAACDSELHDQLVAEPIVGIDILKNYHQHRHSSLFGNVWEASNAMRGINRRAVNMLSMVAMVPMLASIGDLLLSTRTEDKGVATNLRENKHFQDFGALKEKLRTAGMAAGGKLINALTLIEFAHIEEQLAGSGKSFEKMSVAERARYTDSEYLLQDVLAKRQAERLKNPQEAIATLVLETDASLDYLRQICGEIKDFLAKEPVPETTNQDLLLGQHAQQFCKDTLLPAIDTLICHSKSDIAGLANHMPSKSTGPEVLGDGGAYVYPGAAELGEAMYGQGGRALKIQPETSPAPHRKPPEASYRPAFSATRNNTAGGAVSAERRAAAVAAGEVTDLVARINARDAARTT